VLASYQLPFDKRGLHPGARGNLARFPLALTFHARKMGRCFSGDVTQRRDLVQLCSAFGVGAGQTHGSASAGVGSSGRDFVQRSSNVRTMDLQTYMP
jgi:hypothetical protein